MSDLIILIAEDDDGHALLIKETIEESGISNQLIRFKDGKELWDFFTGDRMDSQYDPSQRYLVLLDINMPRMGGLEVLRKLKSEKEFRKIPVMMLTTTDDPREVENCYQMGCSVYITKPIDFNRFITTLKRLGLFIEIIEV